MADVGRPAVYNDPGILQATIEEYFAQEGKKTITGLAYHLGFESRQSFYDYEKHDEFSYIIKRARLKVETMYEEQLSGTAPTGSIFALKNMGWKDKTETEISGGMNLVWNEQKTYETKDDQSPHMENKSL
jgi:hypothetical protein